MAIVIRGKEAGKVINLDQWCNDWATSDGKVYSISNLELSTGEVLNILNSETGMMNIMFELRPYKEGFRFYKRRRYGNK